MVRQPEFYRPGMGASSQRDFLHSFPQYDIHCLPQPSSQAVWLVNARVAYHPTVLVEIDERSLSTSANSHEDKAVRVGLQKAQ